MVKRKKAPPRLNPEERRHALAVVIVGLEANIERTQKQIDDLEASNPLLGEGWKRGMVKYWRQRLTELRATRDRLLHAEERMAGNP